MNVHDNPSYSCVFVETKNVNLTAVMKEKSMCNQSHKVSLCGDNKCQHQIFQ